MENSNLRRLDVDGIFSNITLFTDYDIGGERSEIIVEEENLEYAIEEIMDNFEKLLRDSFEPYDEEEEEW